jgi:16S rRNA (uracil1498-N3)-methyltransferase
MTESLTEPAHRVTLYQSLPKTGKMETIIQKCTELGVAAIAPVVSERCVVRPEKDWENKRQRYQRVAYEAAKQSKRGVIPEVLPLKPLAACDFSQYDLVLFAYEEEREYMLKQALRTEQARTAKNIAVIIGPEGGFEESESAQLCENGAVRVSLGTRILRTETAGMAMLAMVLYELEG